MPTYDPDMPRLNAAQRGLAAINRITGERKPRPLLRDLLYATPARERRLLEEREATGSAKYRHQ